MDGTIPPHSEVPFDFEREQPETQKQPEHAEKAKSSRFNKLRRRIPSTKLGKLAAVATAVVLVVGASDVLRSLGVLETNTKTITEVPQPEVIIRKIDPINLDLFAKVESTIHLQADQHVETTASFFGIAHLSKTWMTNSTVSTSDGVGFLGVDKDNTKVLLKKYTKTGKEELDITINEFSSMGFIDHNGNDGPESNPAWGQRVANVFWGESSVHTADAGLNLITQTLASQSGCLTEAIPVAKQKIRENYVDLARTISGGIISANDVHITYLHELAHQPLLPEGKINVQLEKAGIKIPKHWGIQFIDPSCVTYINGKPAVAGQAAG